MFFESASKAKLQKKINAQIEDPYLQTGNFKTLTLEEFDEDEDQDDMEKNMEL